MDLHVDVDSVGTLSASSDAWSAGVTLPPLVKFLAGPLRFCIHLERITLTLQSRPWLVALAAPRLGSHGPGDSLCAQSACCAGKYCRLRTAVHILRRGLDLSLFEESRCTSSPLLWLSCCRHCCFRRRIHVPLAIRSRTASICRLSSRTAPQDS